MPFIFSDNHIIESSELKLLPSNRSFKYGDGVFETIRIAEKNPLFIELHIKRLFAGMQLLQIHIPENWNTGFFSDCIHQLLQKNDLTHARCRIAVWRAGEGLYKPQRDDAQLLIELFPLEKEAYILNAKGLSLGIFDAIPKLMHPLSSVKTANSIIYVLAAKYAQDKGFDDVVLLNTEGRPADCISSNLFLYRDGVLSTPAISEGAVDGVMRRIIIGHFKKNNTEVNESKIEIQDLLDADELFLTNVIQGIKWVQHFNGKEYGNAFSAKLIATLNAISQT